SPGAPRRIRRHTAADAQDISEAIMRPLRSSILQRRAPLQHDIAIIPPPDSAYGIVRAARASWRLPYPLPSLHGRFGHADNRAAADVPPGPKTQARSNRRGLAKRERQD